MVNVLCVCLCVCVDWRQSWPWTVDLDEPFYVKFPQKPPATTRAIVGKQLQVSTLKTQGFTCHAQKASTEALQLAPGCSKVGCGAAEESIDTQLHGFRSWGSQLCTTVVSGVRSQGLQRCLVRMMYGCECCACGRR